MSTTKKKQKAVQLHPDTAPVSAEQRRRSFQSRLAQIGKISNPGIRARLLKKLREEAEQYGAKQAS